MPIYKLRNTIMDYAWGTNDYIPKLLGQKFISKQLAKPAAELWIGTHPKAPSQFYDKKTKKWLNLNVTIQLPFLLKILSIKDPLSIQVHPNVIQAKNGFLRENLLKIASNDLRRNYRDSNHKPELFYTLSDVWVLVGFRDLNEISSLLKIFCPETLIQQLDQFNLKKNLKNLFSEIINLNDSRRKEVLKEALVYAKLLIKESKIINNSALYDLCDWIIKLNQKYPDDVGVIFPLFLNLIKLKPGSAMFLPAGVLHAYLSGNMVEIMANSDNVIRGGLTPKHIDKNELLNIVVFDTKGVNFIKPKIISDVEESYKTPAKEFLLSTILITKDNQLEQYQDPEKSDTNLNRKNQPQIILCIAGNGKIIYDDGGVMKVISIKKGDSFYISSDIKNFIIQGKLKIFKAKNQ